MSEWHSSFFGDLVVHQKGFAFKSSEYESQGHPVIRVSNFTERSIDMTDCNYINPKNVNQYSEFSLCKGDVVIATVGSWANNPASVVGKAIYVPSEAQNALLNQNAVRLRATNQLDQRFMFYLLKTEDFQNYIVGTAQGSANQASITLKDIFSFSFDCPPLPEQRAIAHILGTLDDKIELNRQMNETLEAMARAIFKSWFVDFDPVRAKAEGRDTGLPEEIAELFPDSFEETEMGEVPKGWQVKKIQEVVKCIKGKSYKSEHLQESQTALVTLKSFARGGGYRADGLKAYTGDYKPEQIVQPGELVIACTDVTQAAEVIGRPAIVESSDKFSIMIASLDVLIVRPSVKNITVPFLYCLFKTDRFADHTYAHSTGTTVLHLSKKAVPSYKFACPPEELHKRFASLTIPIFTRIDTIEQESRTLAELRDTLLPKLISGELRIKDAGEIIGNVPVE